MFNLIRWLFNMLRYVQVSYYTFVYLHLHLYWGDTDLSFVAICKSSLNKAYNNIDFTSSNTDTDSF